MNAHEVVGGYYLLDEKPLGSSARVVVVAGYPRVPGIRSWIKGARFTVPVPQPLAFVLDDGVAGGFADYLRGTVPLMSLRMLAALQHAGVDNLDTYEAVLRHEDGSVASEEYRAVNVIGVASVADEARSVYAVDMPDRLINASFDSLAIDEKRANGLLLFRLAEAVSGIVVHESVRRSLESQGIDRVGFLDPAEWVS